MSALQTNPCTAVWVNGEDDADSVKMLELSELPELLADPEAFVSGLRGAK